MPADASAAAVALSRQRRIGLRVALAVAAGFTLSLATGEVIPFFGPVLAVQFLILGAGPLPLSKAVAFVGLVLVVGQAFIVLSGIFGNHPIQLLALLGLFFFVCFFLQARGQGGPVIFLCLAIAITVTLLDRVHDTLDTSIIAILLQAYLSAVVLSWLAHAILPGHDATGDAPQAAPATDGPAMQALADAAILLGAMTLCLTNNALSLALVLPITVASVLLQFDFATSVRSALSTVAVNLLSGVLASLAFAFVELRPSLPFLFLTIFLVGLILGGRAAAGRAKMYAGALTTFLILFGSGISPLPTTTPESFATRIGYVLLAVGYTLCMMALLWRRERYVPTQLSLRSSGRAATRRRGSPAAPLP
jgi:Protein of unknown function (DUF2955)